MMLLIKTMTLVLKGLTYIITDHPIGLTAILEVMFVSTFVSAIILCLSSRLPLYHQNLSPQIFNSINTITILNSN
jgi:hypothetical protein